MIGVVTILTALIFLEGGAVEVGLIGIGVGLVLTLVKTEETDD